MGQDVSLHLRPIFATRDGMDVLAVTDTQILFESRLNGFHIGRIQESEDEAALVLSAPLEGPEKCLHPPRSPGLLPRATFVDNRNLLIIDDVQTFFRVIRSSDNFFQKNLERKAFPLALDGCPVRSLKSRDGNAYFTTIASNLSEIWKISVPDPKSSQEQIMVEKCGEYRPRQGSHIMMSTSNGRIHVGKLLNEPTSHRNPLPWNFIGDLHSGDYHIIDGSEHDSIQICGDMALLWTFSWDTLGLSVFRLEDDGNSYTQADYETRIPLPGRQLEIFNLKMEVHIAESGRGRFFLKRDHELLMGYLPGADVPLEDVAAATVWRSLPLNAQRELLNKNRLSRRQILLRAMGVDDKKELRNRGKVSAGPMVDNKKRL